MADVINQIFASIQTQFIDPIGGNLAGIVGPVWFIALVIAVLSLVFGFGGMQRGMKIGALVGLVLFGYVWFGYGDELIGAITGNAAVPGADAAASAPAASPADAGAAQAAPAGTGNGGSAADGVRGLAQASLKG